MATLDSPIKILPNEISTPYLACRYLGTAVCDGHAIDEQNPSFEHLRKLYSCFRPVVMEENRRARFRYGWSSQTLAGTSSQLQIAAEDDNVMDEAAHQEVYLDEGERFSQLCTVTNIVTQGARPGLFTRHINISEGVIRVFRDWLASMLERPSSLRSGASSSSAPVAVTGATLASSGVFSLDDSRVLWVDSTQNVGLRFRVLPGPDVRGTIFEDEPPVFYNLIYEELIVRTSTLLMAVEEAADKHVSHSGKDIIIAAM
ncbi:hypothetical protein BBK36DRAFT_1118021 [Trichoderma citrinoviride]|uniref:Uncharacterized protein n=1 Tax=Trichoderma citrinoviride TaxID=58853 RepID=A0A2T4BC71_9HYPO|nr:hypothetical protein BBK36DRAFT_1118021 [Trichoderma citrinoviride]PTB66915.1 hypothetical protein BBK36DRAFT_1118021 [Trichoderma citrinoviride]